MARVNVETSAIAENRFFEFALDMGFQRHEAIGLLVLVWHDSQERKFIEGTKEEILAFIPLKKDRKEECFNALLQNSYLSPISGDRFEIRGNRRHVETLLRIKSLRSSAGSSSVKAKRKQVLRTQFNKRQQTSTPVEQESTFVDRNAVQCNAIQFNSIQSNTKQNNTIQKSKESSELQPVPKTASSSRGVVASLKGDSTVETLLGGVTREAQNAWLKAYPSAEWIVTEVLRANAWIESNPQKRPKVFGRFMANWLGRAFESYRKGIPSRRQTTSEVNASVIGELWQRNQKGEL